MPREPEPTPIRRVLMQSIMWIVLGATVAAAGAMNHYKRRALNPSLDEPVKLNGVSVRLPAGWTVAEEEFDDSIIRQSNRFDDRVVFTVRQRSLPEALGLVGNQPTQGQTYVEHIDMGGTSVKLMLQQGRSRSGGYVAVLEASRGLPKARLLSLTLLVSGANQSQLKPAIDLMKRMAASVEVDANY